MKHESEYEAQYAEEEKRKGGLCPKLVTPGEQGYPDRLVLRGVGPAKTLLQLWLLDCARNPRPMTEADIDELAKAMLGAAIRFVEFKRNNKAPFQPRQPHVIRELRVRGFRVDIYEGDELVSE